MAINCLCQDNYGLAAQPQTFDPFVMNTQHLQRMWHNIGGDKAWWQLFFARRNTTKWTINLGALFTPIPPLQAVAEQGGSNRGGKHPKWNGCQAMSTPVTVWVAGVTVLQLIGLVGFLIRASHMPLKDALLGGFAGLAGLSALARVCDQYAGQWKTAIVQSYIATMLLYYFLLKQGAA